MRVVLGLEYDGSAFAGWQKQKNTSLVSVQATLEKALSSVADTPIQVVCAGRTDRGVHALCQVVHFDTEVEREERSWRLGANSNLPRNMSVKWVKFMNDDFHARFSAVSRQYQYFIYNSLSRSGLLEKKLTWHLQTLNVKQMNEAVQCLKGKHDFSSFRAADCQANSPIRTITEASVVDFNGLIKLEVKANAFLYHMIRNIAGTLLLIGEGKQPVAWMKEVLVAKDRKVAGVTASPNGLYLTNVQYPEEYAIPVPGQIGFIGV
jgi:tRNA pseudouridine38-40 synthase